jgi:HSP20 family protein
MPSLRRIMEDFWNNESLFDKALFNGDSRVPAVNIKENEKNFEIEVAAPGFEKQDFQLNLEDNVLTISAESSRQNQEEKESFTRKEFSYTSFSRSFSLPETVKDEEIKAHYENGLLHLTLTKAERVNQKKVIPIE